MKLLISPTLALLFQHVIGASGTETSRQFVPGNCTVLKTDTTFPTLAQWQSALPGVLPRKVNWLGTARPDYRYIPKSASDVEKAVQFVTKHNLRISIINTGHDYQGRNDASSGLSLDVSQLRGVTVTSNFIPTSEGAKSPVPGQPVALVSNLHAPGKQSAATFGVGVVGSELNRALKASKLFAVSGGAATVSVAGGWGQSGGHSFVSHLYGIGVDQFLEFKVVTADGKLKVANSKTNPDLFWALRGGGGGAWGVVTEATVKVYPSPPTVLYLVAINSSTATLNSYLNRTDGKDAAGLYDAIAYLGSQFPSMVDKGTGGIFLTTPYGFMGGSIFVGENATEAYAKSIWEPVLNKMKTFPGMDRWVASISVYPMYQDFFTTMWPGVGKTTGGSGTGESLTNATTGVSARYGNLFKLFVDKGMVRERDLREHLSFIPTERQSKRSPQAPSDWTPYTTTGDYSPPNAHGKFPMDNILLDRKHLEGLPSAPFQVKRAFASRHIIEIVSGPATHAKGNDTSVVPAWRKAYISCYSPYYPPYASADTLRGYAPDAGAYVNEAYYGAKNWKNAFWGTNYPKLSEIKSKWDVNNTFWVTPGVNADHMEVRDGRVCQALPGSAEKLNGIVPTSDNPNGIDLMANLRDFMGLGVPYRGQ
ncbi:FAD-binding domain-containing protein [Microthyrium microscopicum]|uniref:FAD-binding domain-containing protein n=1 Tax=Microthyrium microscopicum TaxID=703497 RepID=A0A6A6TVQ6_9PEZI|nr:FAD-binding domain-containing protein [Microthyrium microscopicum]